jgi:hypothetical protein
VVKIAILFADKASLEGVTLRFLEAERGEPPDAIGDTSSISAVAVRVGVDGVVISDLLAKGKSELRGRGRGQG